MLKRRNPVLATEPTGLPRLRDALWDIDRVFGIESVLQIARRTSVSTYYAASALGYYWVHSKAGSMHLALSATGQFEETDFRKQAEYVADLIRTTGARRVLELGCGVGFNLQTLAAICPDVDIVGIDLLDQHVRCATERTARLPNVSVHLGSHDQLPTGIGAFDIVFAVETLCYVQDRSSVARSIADVMMPGGALVVFDAARSPRLERYSERLQLAVRLYEAVTVVTEGFAEIDAWTSAFAEAGLTVTETYDLSEFTRPGLRRLYGYGARFFSDPALRTAARLLPWALRANAVGALLGPYLIEGEHEPDGTPQRSALVYLRSVYRLQ